MVNDDVIDLVVERLVNRIENVNTYILKQMGESIMAIRDLTPSQAQAMIQILKYGGDFDKIVEKLAEIANLNVKDILDIFEGVAKRDYAFAERFYNYNNKKYIPYKDNRALQNQVDSLGRITAGDYVNLTRTSALGYGIVNDNTGEVEFKGIGEAYSDLLDDAVVSISQGKETFDQAVGRHMKKIAESGLKVVYPTTYVSKTGQVKNYTRRLDSAVREAVRTGLRELHMSNQEMFGNEFGADGVEISVHTNPAPDHAAVQGKQFSNEEFRKFQNDERAVSYDGEVFEPAFNGRDRRAINQYNCYHRTFPIVLGVSKPEYSNEELENIIEENEKGFELDGKKYTNYEGTQLQRKLETKIREQKDLNIMAKASGNNKLVEESQIKINELTDKYKELCQISGLPPLNERLRVAGYRKSKVEKIDRNYKDYFENYNNVDDATRFDRVIEVDNIFTKKYEKVYKNMSEETKDAFKNYAGQYYKDINKTILGIKLDDTDNWKGLNGVHNINDYKDKINQWVDKMDMEINKNSLNENIVLWKGTLSKYYKDLKPGDEFTIDTFMSTAINRNVAETFMWNKEGAVALKIKSPDYAKGIYVGDEFGLGEGEILLGRKQKYKYIKTYEEEGATVEFKKKNQKIKIIELEIIK